MTYDDGSGAHPLCRPRDRAAGPALEQAPLPTARKELSPVPTTSPTRQPANLMSLAEVLAELRVPKSTFFRWKAQGKAPRTIKYPNGSVWVRRIDLERWIAEHEEAAA
jgi:predicted DNA-binding transcriptional regulator AlpA